MVSNFPCIGKRIGNIDSGTGWFTHNQVTVLALMSSASD